jgi:hypothetical protein
MSYCVTFDSSSSSLTSKLSFRRASAPDWFTIEKDLTVETFNGVVFSSPTLWIPWFLSITERQPSASIQSNNGEPVEWNPRTTAPKTS